MADFNTSLKAGTMLSHGTYRIERVLGRGGFGITYLAVNTLLGTKVAIKEFFPKGMLNRVSGTTGASIAADENTYLTLKLKTKFIKEAQRLASLRHPSIVNVTNAFEENETAYYVMDLVNGPDLNSLVKTSGALSVSQAVNYITQVGNALEYIHSLKINHLDVKPANIMIDRSDDRAILLDFGLSKQYDDGNRQTSTTPTGVSDGYAPIEQYRTDGVSEFSAVSDVYSLGATLYFLLTAQRPPSADDLIENELTFPSNVPDYLRTAIRRAMATRRTDRYQSVTEFLDAIKGTAPTSAKPKTKTAGDQSTRILATPVEVSSPKKPISKPSSPSWVWWLTGIAIAFLTLIAIYSYPLTCRIASLFDTNTIVGKIILGILTLGIFGGLAFFQKKRSKFASLTLMGATIVGSIMPLVIQSSEAEIYYQDGIGTGSVDGYIFFYNKNGVNIQYGPFENTTIFRKESLSEIGIPYAKFGFVHFDDNDRIGRVHIRVFDNDGHELYYYDSDWLPIDFAEEQYQEIVGRYNTTGKLEFDTGIFDKAAEQYRTKKSND